MRKRAVKIILGSLVLFIVMVFVSPIFAEDELKMIEQRHKELLTGITDKKPDHAAIEGNINDALAIRNKYIAEGLTETWHKRKQVLYQLVVLTGHRVAKMEVDTAKTYADNGYKKEAKKWYRDVITRYTGDAYKTYVKQAEFGLEDLKESNKAIELDQ